MNFFEKKKQLFFFNFQREFARNPPGGAAHPRSTTAGWNDPGSFEGHGWGYNSPWPSSFHLLNKYGKQGLRCVYPTDYKP